MSATASALTGASRVSASWLTVPRASGPKTTPATMYPTMAGPRIAFAISPTVYAARMRKPNVRSACEP